MLFIDAEGTKEQLSKADRELEKIGYLQNNLQKNSIVLIEFSLKDVPGSATDILKLIDDFNFNISYISSQENGTDYQNFKMGLYVDEPDKITRFLKEAEKLCKAQVIDYNSSEKFYDNSIFYDTYVTGLTKAAGLSDKRTGELLVHVNLAMQTLDEKGISPYRTFDSISKFAELLGKARGKAFEPRITKHNIAENTEIILIEPPCGSNTMIIKSADKVLFVDTGYACYKEEMLEIIKKIIPKFDEIKKTVLVTHADVDHCGLLYLFDEIIANEKTALCLENEYNGKSGYRDENPLHKPYINICKILTEYQPANPKKITVPWKGTVASKLLTQIGFFDFGELHFEVYEGKGGHLPGEIVMIDYENHIAITGDVYVNTHGFTKEQEEYNRYAPILMTSVDTNPNLCCEERQAVINRLGKGKWQIFGAHGMKKDYSVDA